MVRAFPTVSFIIPTLNEQEGISRCIKAIHAQNYPSKKIEILIADGGSTDKTISIAKKLGARIIKNPDKLHEPGKTRAASYAKGNILFFTDADNILSHENWIRMMIAPYKNKKIFGFLPQTIPAPDSNSLDKYLGWLYTDPFTWFIYGDLANPSTYSVTLTPISRQKGYDVYKFDAMNTPLFGLSQGSGMRSDFKRDAIGSSDDILAGIKLICEGGLVAYVPEAGVYHYHVSGLPNFIAKYRWRIRNNMIKKVENMGVLARLDHFRLTRKIKMVLFIPYGLSVFAPLYHAIKFYLQSRHFYVFWHVIASFILAMLIIQESILTMLGRNIHLSEYE